jgi:hypothetical protein
MLNALFVFSQDQLYRDIGKQKECNYANLHKGYAVIAHQIVFVFAYIEPLRSQIITPVSPGETENKPYKQQHVRNKETTDKNTG